MWLPNFFRKLLSIKLVIPDDIQDKINDINQQISDITASKMIKFKPIGGPELMEPEELITFQKKRIKVLEKARINTHKQIRNDLESYYNVLCKPCRTEFNTKGQIGVTCQKDFKPFSYMILLREVLNLGPR